jgi:hypothetical protein
MEKCPITGIELTRVDSGSYRINVNGEYLFTRHGIRFDALLDKEDFIKNKYIFAGAILTKQLPDKEPVDVYWFSLTLDDYKEKLEKIIYPKTPKSKLDNLFLSLFKMQKFDGELVKINNIVPKEAQEVGFTLSEIKTLLDKWYIGKSTKEEKLEFFEAKIIEIDNKIKHLRQAKKRLVEVKKDIEKGECQDEAKF